MSVTYQKVYLEQLAKELIPIVRFNIVKSANLFDKNRNSLANSQLVKSVDAEISDVGFDILANFYWEFVDGGRKAGHMPKFTDLVLWAQRYGIKPRAGQTNDEMINAISKKIFNKGIKARPFLDNAFNDAVTFINPFSDKALDELLRKSFDLK